MTLAEFKIFERQKGKFFFSPNSIQAFHARVAHWCESGYFVTSEWIGATTPIRRYTLRKADFETGSVYLVSKFIEHSSLYMAKKDLRECLRAAAQVEAKCATI